MGLIEIEKTNQKKQTPKVTYSDTVYRNDTLNNLNNVGNENYVFETEKERIASDNLVSHGMNGNKIQVEGKLFPMCLTTFICSTLLLFVIVTLMYIVLTSSNSIEIFPYKSNYTAEEFNTYLKRSFIILFGIVSFMSIASMIVINNAVKARFRNNYLSKFKVYIYDIFIVIQNAILYIYEMIVMFSILNDIHYNFVTWQTSGKILGSVNIDTIEIFKYVVVIIMTIFIVINSFSSIDIIHSKNKFILEEQI